MRKIFVIAVISILYFSACNNDGSNKTQDDAVPKDVFMYGIKVNNLEVEVDTVDAGECLAAVLLPSGLDDEITHQVITSCDTLFDVRKFKTGNSYTKMYSDSSLRYLVYEISLSDYIVFDMSDSIPSVYLGQKKVSYVVRKQKGIIESSLWNTMVDNNIDPSVAIALSEIYAWSIDFFGLQKGDNFKIVYTEKYVDTTSVGVESINYVVFNHMGQDYYAIPFEQDGIMQFFDENGKSTRKAFLKSPLKYSRISSHFSGGRMHPILKIVRPHYGVDYAAPVGTPVHTIGDGVVVKKGYSGGAGNMITIKHNTTYSTSYMHLSRYAIGISPGSRVHQGQLIGYVGSSGLSTGPHLDFRVYKNGTPINPLKMISPPTSPVKKADMPAFKVVADSLVHILQSF